MVLQLDHRECAASALRPVQRLPPQRLDTRRDPVAVGVVHQLRIYVGQVQCVLQRGGGSTQPAADSAIDVALAVIAAAAELRNEIGADSVDESLFERMGRGARLDTESQLQHSTRKNAAETSRFVDESTFKKWVSKNERSRF